MRYRKIIFLISVALILTLPASAAESNTPINWGMPRIKNNQRPLSSGVPFLEEVGAYFVGSDEKVVYLTFDAGYENGNVKRIADTLKARNVKGAFFLLEHFITANIDLVKQLANDGHLICNHTAKHKDITKFTNKESFEADLKRLENAYKEATGKEMSKFFRPPEGRFSKQSLEWANSLGYKTIFWSVAYADWDNNKQMPKEKALDILMSRVHNGAIILLHPTSETNADLMDEFITRLENDGWRFGTLDELA